MRKQTVINLVGIGVGISIGLLLAGPRLKVLPNIPKYYKVAAMLPDEIKAAKQEGLLMTPADLERPVPVPDNQNAALLYSQFPPVKVSDQEDAVRSAVLKGKATAADRQATQRLLDKAAPQLRLAEQAAALPDCDFHRNWKLGPNLLLPEYAPIRETARLLGVKAVMQSDAGHPEAALHTVWVGMRMAQHLTRDPLLIPFLVRIAVESIMDRAFQYVVKHNADRPDILHLAAQT